VAVFLIEVICALARVREIRQMKNVVPVLALCLLRAGVSAADVAPMRYEGFTLSVQENAEVRMQSEEVNIYCGRHCLVNAQFEMCNETDQPINLFVGFPVRNEETDEQEVVYDFRVRANGGDWFTDVFKIRDSAEPFTLLPWVESSESLAPLAWVGWPQSFCPGRTLLEVEYHIEPSGSYREPWLNIFYVLETGEYWKGTIGQAVVAIHFEEPLAAEQVRAGTMPKGFQVDGCKVCWRFTEVEPTREDNIQLEYMPFAIYRKLQRLRHSVEQNPGDEAAVVELGRHCFALGPYWGLRGYVPSQLSPVEFRSIVAKVADPDDKAVFQDTYRRTARRALREARTGSLKLNRGAQVDDDVIYALVESPDVSSQRIEHILCSIDYGSQNLSEYVAEGRNALESLLRKNPGNGDAWMVYLSNWYRFKWVGFAPWYRWIGVPFPWARRRQSAVPIRIAHFTQESRPGTISS
jgi:hypothetical protein